MKASAKRRRSRKEIEEQKLEDEAQAAAIARKLARIDELEEAHIQMSAQIEMASQMHHTIQNFVDVGAIKIDESGVASVVDDPNER